MVVMPPSASVDVPVVTVVVERTSVVVEAPEELTPSDPELPHPARAPAIARSSRVMSHVGRSAAPRAARVSGTHGNLGIMRGVVSKKSAAARGALKKRTGRGPWVTSSARVSRHKCPGDTTGGTRSGAWAEAPDRALVTIEAAPRSALPMPTGRPGTDRVPLLGAAFQVIRTGNSRAFHRTSDRTRPDGQALGRRSTRSSSSRGRPSRPRPPHVRVTPASPACCTGSN